MSVKVSGEGNHHIRRKRFAPVSDRGVISGLSPHEFSCLSGATVNIQEQLNDVFNSIHFIKEDIKQIEGVVEIGLDHLLYYNLYALVLNGKVINILCANPDARWNLLENPGYSVVKIMSHCEVGMRFDGKSFYKETMWMKIKRIFKR